MMESAGQLLLSAPPLQLPPMSSAQMMTTAGATDNTSSSMCCFVTAVGGGQQTHQAMANGGNCLEHSNIPLGTDHSDNADPRALLLSMKRETEPAMAGDEAPIDVQSLQPPSSEEEEGGAPIRPKAEMEPMESGENGACANEFMQPVGKGQTQENSTMETAVGQTSAAGIAAGQNGKPLPVIKPPGDEKEERPSLSYKDLIIEAIESSPERRLKLSEIYQVIKYLHPYYQRRADQWGWQNSIRHNLSLHDCFVKLPLKQTSANGVVGHFWTVIHRSPEDKQGPTRRRSRANAGGTGTGKGKKGGGGQAQQQQQQNVQQPNAAGGKAKGLKGRQSVSSDSGVMSDDGGASGSQSGTISPMAGGSASVPALLQIPSNSGEQHLGKFQPLQSPLALNSHQASSLHLPLSQPQTAPILAQQPQNLLTPLELMLNAQQNLIQSPQQPAAQQQQFQFSPIPGKTAPSQPALLEQQLQQLLAMANFAQQQAQPAAAPISTQPNTPASAPPSLLQPMLAQTAATSSSTADGGLNLLSHLASQALAAAVTPQPAATTPQTPQLQSANNTANNNPLAIAAAAAAAELQRLQLLQLYAQQQQQQLQQQIQLLENSQREQQQLNHQQLRLGAAGGHSAPLSPVHEQQQPSGTVAGGQTGEQSFLTQLLLAKLLSSNTAEHPQLQQHIHAPAARTSPPPPMSAPAMVNSPMLAPHQHHQQLELQQAALLLEQYQQQQQRQHQLALLEQLQQQQHQLEAQVHAAMVGAVAATQPQQIQAVQLAQAVQEDGSGIADAELAVI